MSACTPLRSGDADRSKGHASAHRPNADDDPKPGGPWSRRRWGADFSASIAVFLIALPLSLGIALAAGAPLQAGLIAGAVGGLVCGWLGGAPLQVTGPAAGLTVITAELIQTYGWRTTCAITVMAGLAQIALGCLRIARSALAVSPAIVHGMLTGIGVTISLAQLHVMLGGSPASSPLTNALELPRQLVEVHPAALSISMLTVVVLLAWPWLKEHGGAIGRYTGKVPPALAAVGLATIAATIADMRLPRVDLPSWHTHALPQMPEGPVLGMATAVLMLTMVASVQALLSAVAADKLTAARRGEERVPRSDLDKELRGHGVANVVSGGLGGLPVTGVAVRSSANIAAGAVSRNSALLQGVWVLLAAALLVGPLEQIPLAALASLVMVVGVQMVNLTHIRSVTRHREALVFGVTTVAVVFIGVLEGVGIGIAVGVVLALHRLARTRISVEQTHSEEPRTERTVSEKAHSAVSVSDGTAGDGMVRQKAVGEGGPVGTQEPDGADGEAGAGGKSGAVGGARAGEEAGVQAADEEYEREEYEDKEYEGEAGGRADGSVGVYRVLVRGQLTFLAVPRLSRALARVPEGAKAVVELDGSFMDHAAYEALDDWRVAHTAQGGSVEVTGRAGQHIAEPPGSHTCKPWTPWRNHQCTRPHDEHTQHTPRRRQLLGGVRNFQRTTAPLVRDELARLAKEGQRPSQLFLTCADSRLVTSMITSSGPGDLFTVRNVGNLVPLPGEETGDESVAAAIEYAVDVLKVGSVTVCGHSGCGAMQALHSQGADPDSDSPLGRWLRHGRPSLERLAAPDGAGIADRETADEVEALCLANVVQQLEHLSAHECVARRVREGALELHGMYFHVGEAQTYVLDLNGTDVGRPVFAAVRPETPAVRGGAEQERGEG
ncbi:bifunctional SulP family inorganic anion transporter/carbonic anhydrase [Streptomyces iconiensis]|uniref:Bifunctional SulP family inorganic anion transporter/carbonic anhydrase n=1 Tax=Streptomyces iconiensis TaxID=1384038 RepID=A0ABT6ZS76_9ACTN|nr:bifunctional SulP family inorganic anion transporter/carbonic anhydrase [Streptomyces iconiensis]MDJ1131894.1 bifunctional SulP family inorganic anion transporter/carbonic anhydrase [Streptomyces iconiensis]